MSALAHAFCIALALSAGIARADDADLSLGGFICARPFAPACVEAPATYKAKARLADCQSDVDRYIAATVAYRDCLQRKIEGGVRRVNDVIDHFHCLSRHESCPPPAKPSTIVSRPPARAN